MKITKRQLRRIIREEYNRLKKTGLIREAFTPEQEAGMKDFDAKFDQAYKQPNGSYSGQPDEPPVHPQRARRELLKQFEQQPGGRTSYPYGRYRGDEKRTHIYTRTDGSEISDEDMAILSAVEKNNHPLGGIYSHERSPDGMSVRIKFYKHTSG
jgi:hypothetical protein